MQNIESVRMLGLTSLIVGKDFNWHFFLKPVSNSNKYQKHRSLFGRKMAKAIKKKANK